jgi:bacterioferritin (cytochrome b1)
MEAQAVRTQPPPGQQRHVYGGYKGKENPTERERIMHLLDVYRSTEGFVAEYMPRWIEASRHEGLKGGLLVIQKREASHAEVLETRLRALGGVPQAVVAAERLEKEIPFFGSTERSDVEKLQVLANLFGDPEEFLKPLTEMIETIHGDQQSKELLRTIVDDERATIKWLVEMHEKLCTAEATA